MIDFTDGGRSGEERKHMMPLHSVQQSEEAFSESVRHEASHRRPHDGRSSSANVMSNSFKTQGSGSSMAMRTV